jgi:hexosaminidase
MVRCLTTVLCLVILPWGALSGESTPPIIPKPLALKVHGGRFRFNQETSIVIAAGGEADLKPVAEELAGRLRHSTGLPIPLLTGEEKGRKNAVTLGLEKDGPGPEGYELVVEKERVAIIGGGAAGVFYGMQTLFQLLPAEPQAGGECSVQCLEVKDRPRFTWRGMHLDVGRHFFPKEFIKKYIDLMAAYKLNTFHWHLTEDQGWRIEIKHYPLLTTIGSRRKETMDDHTPHGGFYTQEDIREVVRYAQSRFITVVPEIEMPGHSLAALAAYPELSCSGGPFTVGTEWGVFNDVYCAGSEKTFEFLENVLSEVTALFPGPYVHIGGDECPKLRWKNCKRCQDRIQNEHLKDEDELQSYFIRRVEKILNARGKRLLGWDEILEGGLAPNATVMSWRGTEGGVQAAKLGHDVVMTPTSRCYFDYYQGMFGEPQAIGGFLPIDSVYGYEPCAEELSGDEAKHILGAQGNMWTEYMPDTRQVEYMLLPRMLALSEVVWSQKGVRDWKDFTGRLDRHYCRLAAWDVNFRVPPPLGSSGRVVMFRDTSIVLKSSIAGSEIRYTLDGQDPTKESPLFRSSVKVTGGTTLSARTLLPCGRMSPPVAASFFLVDPKVNGLRYTYYEGEWDSLPEMRTLQPLKKGRAYDISLSGVPHRADHFAVQFEGQLKIEREGEYTFWTNPDDGSRLLVDGTPVVENDGPHAPREAQGKLTLSAGMHTLSVLYLQITGGSSLDVLVEGPQLPKQVIPPDLLYFR